MKHILFFIRERMGMPLKTAGSVSYTHLDVYKRQRCAGILGAVVAVIGTVLPPLVILTVISYCYEAFIKIQWIQIMLFGMQAGVVATICDVVWTMGKEVWSQPQKVYVLIMLVAFVCNVLFDVNLLIIIVVCGALGYMIERAMKKEGGLQ